MCYFLWFILYYTTVLQFLIKKVFFFFSLVLVPLGCSQYHIHRRCFFKKWRRGLLFFGRQHSTDQQHYFTSQLMSCSTWRNTVLDVDIIHFLFFSFVIIINVVSCVWHLVTVLSWIYRLGYLWIKVKPCALL